MDAEQIRTMAIEAAESAFHYFDDMQQSGLLASESTVSVNKYTLRNDYAVLQLSRRINPDSELRLSVDGKLFSEEQVRYEQYDEDSLTVAIFPCPEVLAALSIQTRQPEVLLITDLKYLITRTEDYYKQYGDMLTLPPTAPPFDADNLVFPAGQTPSAQQRKAVQTILGRKLTYIWGAPGTGKTQFVLSTAIFAYLQKNQRVLVVAPTNNALEQVLRGLLQILALNDPEGKTVDLRTDILRLGIPTAAFLHDYPQVCEAKGIDARIKAREDTGAVLRAALFEKQCEVLKAHFDELDSLFGEEYDRADYAGRQRIMHEVRACLTEIRAVTATNDKFAHLMDGVDEYNCRSQYPGVAKSLYERPRPALDIGLYRDCTIEELNEKIGTVQQEIEELRAQDPQAKLETAKIVAATPPTFMNRCRPRAPEGEPPEPGFDHIFIDEVGYCNVIQILPFFTLGAPVTMLGDHMQLPPVCEIDRETVLEPAINEHNDLKNAFMWDQPALFAEEYLTEEAPVLTKAYLEDTPPKFTETAECDLTESHRFGNNLAQILDECIYKNGIRGLAAQPLTIVCADATCTTKKDRENPGEAAAVKKYIEDNRLDPDEFTVLTPYKKQVQLLKAILPPEYQENVLTVHKSQGREWDTVILSVADNGVRDNNKDFPLRFTSTKPGSSGIKVINTAVSRAKKTLVIVCDRQFWANTEDEMLGDLVRQADRYLSYREHR